MNGIDVTLKVLWLGLQHDCQGSDMKMTLSNFPDKCLPAHKFSNYFTEIPT